MATKLAISFSITPILPFPAKLSPQLALYHTAVSSRTKAKQFRIYAEPGLHIHFLFFIKQIFYIELDICKIRVLILLLLSGGGEQGDLKQKDKKFITKEQEPEQ